MEAIADHEAKTLSFFQPVPTPTPPEEGMNTQGGDEYPEAGINAIVDHEAKTLSFFQPVPTPTPPEEGMNTQGGDEHHEAGMKAIVITRPKHCRSLNRYPPLPLRRRG